MANFLLVYTGDVAPPPTSPEEGEKVMQAWMGWFGQLGGAVVDGGNPTSNVKTVASNGSVSDGGPSKVGGYSILSANSLDEAVNLAKGCPHLAAGGRVEVYETFNVG